MLGQTAETQTDGFAGPAVKPGILDEIPKDNVATTIGSTIPPARHDTTWQQEKTWRTTLKLVRPTTSNFHREDHEARPCRQANKG